MLINNLLLIAIVHNIESELNKNWNVVFFITINSFSFWYLFVNIYSVFFFIIGFGKFCSVTWSDMKNIDDVCVCCK